MVLCWCCGVYIKMKFPSDEGREILAFGLTIFKAVLNLLLQLFEWNEQATLKLYRPPTDLLNGPKSQTIIYQAI